MFFGSICRARAFRHRRTSRSIGWQSRLMSFSHLRRQSYFIKLFIRFFGVHLLGGSVRAIHPRPLLPAPVAPSIQQNKKHWLPYQCFLLFNPLSFILCFPCPKGLSVLTILFLLLTRHCRADLVAFLFMSVKPLSLPPPGAPL
jgi:hypothetical protein